jgi:DNA helicase II / ATP-dependent DNA helicase PcrA
MSQLLDGLNPSQRRAVETIAGPVLVLAGPGSGKTRVLTHRIAYLIKTVGVDPYNILAVTFTNKAAREMKERLEALIGHGAAQALTVGTFHSVCSRFLRRDIQHLGRERDFAIYDSDDQDRLMRRVLRDLNLDEKQNPPRAIHGRISSAKNELVSPAEYARLNRTYFDEIVARCYERYQALLRESNALDFDDILVETVRLFDQHPAVLEKYQERYAYLLVDEYQDTNRAQYILVKQLAAKRRNLFVVGDDDQCFPAGALVRTPEGERPIEQILPGDTVVAGAGRGTTTLATVLNVRSRPYSGKLIRATLAGGQVLEATPNHMCFARLGLREDVHYVYLMFREDKGYRIGQTVAAQAKGEQSPVKGLPKRVHQEKASRAWILRACHSPGEATIYEHYYSVNYGLPRSVFVGTGSGDTTRQLEIDWIYNSVDTRQNVHRLFDDQGIFSEMPHYVSQSSVDVWEEDVLRPKHYDRSWQPGVEHVRFASFTKSERFAFQPAAHLRPTMIVPAWRDGALVDEEIVKVEEVEYEGAIYDLDVEHLHNYIASGVAVHNSVYGWRGADVRNIRQFEQDYPDAQVVLLEQNYRSTQSILDTATAVINAGDKRKHVKQLWTENGEGLQVSLHEGYDQDEEAAFVVDEIARLVASGDFALRDCAVMYRTNAQSRALEEALIRRGLRYQIVGGTRFYERKEIKDVLAYLRLAHNPYDSVSLTRVLNWPGRGIGDRSEAELTRWASELGVPVFQALKELEDDAVKSPFNSRTATALRGFYRLLDELLDARRELPLVELLDRILDRVGVREALVREYGVEEADDRWANVEELRTVASDYVNMPPEVQLATFLEEVALVADVDKLDPEADAITCITLHQAKGLEYPAVFLIGLEEGLLPHSRSTDERDKVEEERRLLYVGMTRAKRRLYLCYAFRRTSFGRTNLSTPSRFLADIPRELLKQPQKRGTAAVSPQSSMFSGRSGVGASYGGSRPQPRGATGSPARSGGGAGQGRAPKPAGPTEVSFFAGQRVRHATFGEGVVMSSRLVDGDEEVTVSFADRERRLLASFARLERISG